MIRGGSALVLLSLLLGGCQSCKKTEPTCSVPESSFRGGLNGYCTRLGTQRFQLHFDDRAGTRLLALTWPDDLSSISPPSVPSVDCAQLCEAGMMVVAETTDRLIPGGSLPGAPPAPANPRATHSCYVAKSARQEYVDCGTGAKFGCFLACGKGCIGCNVQVFSTNCGPPGTSCSGRRFRCYTRPCCTEHDKAMRDARTGSTNTRQMVVHMILDTIVVGVKNGCGFADIYGDTWDKADATCLDFDDLCLVD